VRELRLNESVRFMDRISLTRIAELMASANVGVVPKRADGFGNEAFSTKIFEFMACGVPVIASRTRIDERYFNEDFVNFFEAGSVTSLADVLLRTYRRSDQQREKVLRARAFAVDHSWQIRCADYRQLVDSLVPAPGASVPAEG
jgi:glycosyltransferase involved in cell wall biosynthesis